MASQWKHLLSMSDRLDRIHAIQARLPDKSMSEAIAIETKVYDTSSSLIEYVQACTSIAPNESPPHQPTTISDLDDVSDSGIRIGKYENCYDIASGVTSVVFRSGNHALKVITTMTNMEPHNPQREVKILTSLKPQNIIQLQESFRDHESQMVLVFPYMPLTLAGLLEQGPLTSSQKVGISRDVLSGLDYIHSEQIIHRDIKPSAVLLSSPNGPAYISDFGTAWHPTLSNTSEPPNRKILDIGTGPYRAPEVLFGNTAYSTAVDMWSFGVLLSECVTVPSKPVFESRPAHEDGSQLGLILSIFKTLGTPREEDWPEAKSFKVSPFELWTVFPKRKWEDILVNIKDDWRDLIASLIRFNGKRSNAKEALDFACLRIDNNTLEIS